jgi:hypothetical protein
VSCRECDGLPLPLPWYYYYQLTGFDDWAAIRAYLAGTRDPGPKTIETDGESREPIVTSISPHTGSANGGTVVTITGTGLDKATQVMFGSVAASQFTVVDKTTITVVAPTLPKYFPGDYPPPSSPVHVTVIADVTASPNVVGDLFTYEPSAGTVVTSVAPSSGPFGGGTTVLIKGSGLYGATAVSFTCTTVAPYTFQAASFNVLDDSTISAVTPNLPNGASLPTAQCAVIVTPLWGSSSAPTPAAQFTFLLVPPPVITALSPTSGPATGGTTVLIKGSNLSGATSVSFIQAGASYSASFTVLDDSTISAVTPNIIAAASLTGPIATDVRVTTPSGTSAITPADQFTFMPTGSPTPSPSPSPTSTPAPPPTLSGFTPSSGPSGTLVTLTGTNLTIPGNPQVLFTGCGAAATVLATPQPDGTLTATVPACATTGPLTVVTAGGSATSSQTFTVGP